MLRNLFATDVALERETGPRPEQELIQELGAKSQILPRSIFKGKPKHQGRGGV